MSPLTVGLLALASILPPTEPLPPPLALTSCLPPHQACLDNQALAQKVLAALEANLGPYDHSGCHPHVAATHRWLCMWDEAVYATWPVAHAWQRRLALQRLIAGYGWRAVLMGDLRAPDFLTGGP